MTRNAREVAAAAGWARTLCVAVVLALAAQAAGAAEPAAAEVDAAEASARAAEAQFAKVPFARWGAETLTQIERDLGQPGSALCAEYGTPDGRRGGDYGKYSFVWPAGFQFRALAAAARVQPQTYRRPLVEFARALDAYWTVRHGVGGYMVLVGDSERFYDDSAWIVLGMIETYQVTGRREFLDRAAKTLAFVAGGEAKTPGGGIRQHEDKTGNTSVCTTAPATVGALRLYRITKDPKYLAMAERWYGWLASKEVGIQDARDGLFDDQARYRDGAWKVVRGKRAYNSALPLQADVLLYQIKKDKAYLERARRIAAACLAEWLRPSGGLRETGQWGGSDLVDALLALYEADKDPRWLAAVRRMLEFLHEKGRDPAGRYGEYWHEDRRDKPLEKFHLLYMAPVARAYWRAAAIGSRPQAPQAPTPDAPAAGPG